MSYNSKCVKHVYGFRKVLIFRTLKFFQATQDQYLAI